MTSSSGGGDHKIKIFVGGAVVQNNQEGREEEMSKSIPMFQCGLCKVKFHLAKDLIAHVEQGEHYDTEDVNMSTNDGQGHVEVTLVERGPTSRSRSKIKTENVEDEDENVNAKEEILRGHDKNDDDEHSLEDLEPDADDAAGQSKPAPPCMFKCFKCPLTFDTTAGLKDHRNSHALDCKYCGEAFYIKPSLDRHLREKHPVVGVVTTPIINSFASDVLIEPGEGCYRCTMCGKTCIARSDMQKHVRRHTDERPYSCHLCDERFKHRSAITNHMRIHTGERPYSCTYCGKQFSQPSNKRRHEGLHRGERPFRCSICARNFSEKTTLQTHMLQHTGERPFTCDKCGKGHITNSALNSHKRSRHCGNKDDGDTQVVGERTRTTSSSTD